MADHAFDSLTEAQLRLRTSLKWRAYPPDVLPAWVAEMDYPLAEPIKRALTEAIAAGDSGYADPAGTGAAFAAWAKKTWSWEVAPPSVILACDVMTGIAEILRVATEPGDGVVIEPPIYFPFADVIRTARRRIVEAPLARDGARWSVDLDAIARAYAAGAKVHLLCSPHNPTGLVLEREVLVAIGDLAQRHGVLVLSDEVHAPLVLGSKVHCPFPLVSEAAARSSIVLTSASKAWNLPGLKAAMLIPGSQETRSVLARLAKDVPFHASVLGVLAGRAAFTEGDAWLEEARSILARNVTSLGALLAEHLPEVRWTPPEASYLAWLDCSALGLGPDPAATFLERGRVALSSGPIFGTNGDGFARLNFATTSALLEEVVLRMKKSVRRSSGASIPERR